MASGGAGNGLAWGGRSSTVARGRAGQGGWIWAGLLVVTGLAPAAPVSAQGRCRIESPPLASEGCPAPYGAADFVFHDPPCDYVPGPYPDSEAYVVPHSWPLPGGAVQIDTEAGLGTCHSRHTVRHRRGRRVGRSRGSIDLDRASCGRLRRLARTRAGHTFTVDSASGQRRPQRSLSAEHVARIAAVGGAQLTLDLAVRRSADLALLAPIADRIVSLRIRSFGRPRPIDLGDLPPIPCLQALAVQGRSVTGVAALRSPALTALEIRGRLSDADVTAIAGLGSLRELRVWPTGPARIARFSAVRQIERLHTRANVRVLEAFAGASLSRLVLDGVAGRPVLRGIADRFDALRTLDVVLSPSLSGRRLPMLASLGHLQTLLLAWEGSPPRLPSLPSLRMLVAGGDLDARAVQWINAQPRLTTVHSPVIDSALRPLLRRASAYSIGRPGAEGLVGAPP